MDNHINVLGREINTKDKSISEVITEVVGIEINEFEANRLYSFISNEFKNKDSVQS